jgi:hypothetical protein
MAFNSNKEVSASLLFIPFIFARGPILTCCGFKLINPHVNVSLRGFTRLIISCCNSYLLFFLARSEVLIEEVKDII